MGGLIGGSSDEDVEDMERSDESELDYEEGLSSSSDDEAHYSLLV